MSAPRPLLALLGATATGKTAVSVAVARRTGAELVNADSRQVIRGLPVATCAPSVEELHGVACHLLALREPGEHFTVVQWLAAAREAVAGLDARRVPALVVGGTGLYVEALVDGIADLPEPDLGRREQRTRIADTAGGVAELAAELAHRDPDGSRTIDLHNPRRVIRALELLDAGVVSVEQPRPRVGAHPGVLVALDIPVERHDVIVRARATRLMLGGELLEEMRGALARGIPRAALARSGIGCSEALAVLDGTLTPEAAVDALTLRTRRYARRQRIWLRRDQRIQWVRHAGESVDEVAGRVLAIAAAGGWPPLTD